MYCQECGKQNGRTALNCTNCGVKLEDNSNRLQKTENQAVNDALQKALESAKKVNLSSIRKMSKKAKGALISVGALFLIVIVFFSVGSIITNPERTVKAYFESYMGGDFETAYNYLSLPDSDFLAKEYYSSYMQSEIKEMAVSQYEIEGDNYYSEGSNAEKAMTKYYSVSYLLTGESSPKSFNVTLVLQPKKKLLFFNHYKVASDNILVQNFNIYAPSNLTITVDGFTLPEKEHSENYYSDLKVYTIPYAFNGKHELSVSSDLFEQYTDTITLLGNDGTTTLNDLTLKESVKNEIAKQTENIFTSMCNSAIAGNTFDKVTGDFTTDVEQLAEIQEQYKSLCERFKKDDGTGLKSIKFESFTDESYSSALSSDFRYQCRLNFDYSYVRLYKEWGSDEITEQNSNGTTGGSVRMTFAYESDTWKLYSFEYYSVYY